MPDVYKKETNNTNLLKKTAKYKKISI